MTLPLPIRWIIALVGPCIIGVVLILASSFFSIRSEVTDFEKLSKTIRSTHSFRNLDITEELERMPPSRRQAVEKLIQFGIQAERNQWEAAESKLASIVFRNETMRDALKDALEIAKKSQSAIPETDGIETLRPRAMKLHVEANAIRQKLRELLVLAPKDVPNKMQREWEKDELATYADGVLLNIPVLEELPSAPKDEAALASALLPLREAGKAAPPMGPVFKGKLAALVEQATQLHEKYGEYVSERDALPLQRKNATELAEQSLQKLRTEVAEQVVYRLRPEIRGWRLLAYPTAAKWAEKLGFDTPEIPEFIREKRANAHAEEKAEKKKSPE